MVSEPELTATLDSVQSNYRYFANVCGVAYGTKFSDGMPLVDTPSVQFFVREKQPEQDLAKPLPKFVYARSSAGDIDRSVRIPTDVIELRNLEMCCFAGNEVTRVGGSTGSVALMFENKTADRKKLVVTCAHVVGDLTEVPADAEIRGGEPIPGGCLFRAHVIASTQANNGQLEYDVAIGEVFSSSDFFDLGLANSPIIFTGFGTDEDRARDSTVEFRSTISPDRTADIASSTTTIRRIETPEGNHVTVHNLIACKGSAVSGDSGGIAFVEDRAVGMLVARADDNWVFIHPIKDALDHLAEESDLSMKCFE